MQTQNVLEMQGICKSFPGVRALHNVSFTLKRVEVHALMGENGAGKSTLIKVMTGVYEKDAGRITVEGKAIHFRSPEDAQDFGVGTVYQEITLCPNLTVAENMFIGRGRYAFVNWRRMKEKTTRLLDSLGIPARPTQGLSSCSLAVQQMIAIARAIDMDCKILILDEPTSGLDPLIQSRFAALLQEWNAQGMTVFFSSHVLPEVQRLCHRVALLKEGRLVAVEEVGALRAGSVKRVASAVGEGSVVIHQVHRYLEHAQAGARASGAPVVSS